MKGLQYDIATGFISGSVSPPLTDEGCLSFPKDDNGNYTRAQLIVDDTVVDYAGMKVDITQNPPVLVPNIV